MTQLHPSVINSVSASKPNLGLARLGGFVPPPQVSTGNTWTLIRQGGTNSPTAFPPPINDIAWKGFCTREVQGYTVKLYWVCGYGILPPDAASGKAVMIMCQWWHTQPVNITDYRMLTGEDWDNANIYSSPIEALEDCFIRSQMNIYNSEQQSQVAIDPPARTSVIEAQPLTQDTSNDVDAPKARETLHMPNKGGR